MMNPTHPDIPYFTMVFVVSAPRSGSTMLERMLEAHPEILGGPEPHIMTPLAHLGYWDKVDKAPYDHILAAESQRLFVQRLPHGEADYWEACRAYCDVLYGRLIESEGKGRKSFCLDKTPAYALVLPFISKVFPDAKYIVLTRHPAAVFASFANSFFDGDYERAYAHNPLLKRYVPALAAFLRKKDANTLHIQYESLVEEPETWMHQICTFIGVSYDPEMLNYGKKREGSNGKEGLGDPIGVEQHSRPTTQSVEKWVEELRADPQKRLFMERIVRELDPDDLQVTGYPIETLWLPLHKAEGHISSSRKSVSVTRYRIQRKLIIYIREYVQRSKFLRRMLSKLRLACDVLLRD